MDFITSLVPGLLIAVITAVTTVWLALGRFYSEQWWSRKAKAYEEILTALFKVRVYARAQAKKGEAATAKCLSPEEEKKLLERSEEGFDELLKASTVNVLFLPKEARKSLEGVLGNVENSWHPASYEQVKPSLDAIHTCINELHKIAKKDLRRNWTTWRTPH